jgi:aminoglycoside phosphotransferase
MKLAARELSAEQAAGIVTAALGSVPMTVRRFPTGARHYVFDVAFADRPGVVVRMGHPSAQPEMAGAVHLSALLRPRGVRLPAILAHDVDAEFPWLLLERLEGTDLGAVIGGFSDDKLDRIAAAVARAQAITATTGSAGRYGYAALPAQAPHATWSRVLGDSLERSRRRIASEGLFDVRLADVVEAMLNTMREQIDSVAATPFLHDTTTKNVIVTTDGNFSGIVDVDDLCFGDPRYPAALTLAALMAYGGPVRYVSAWLHHAGQPDDRVFRLYVALFLLDLMAEHGQSFNGNERPSTPEARAALCCAFEASRAGLGQKVP